MSEPLIRIADALERLSPPLAAAPDFEAAEAFVWHAEPDRLLPVPDVSRVDLVELVESPDGSTFEVEGIRSVTFLIGKRVHRWTREEPVGFGDEFAIGTPIVETIYVLHPG